LVWRRICVVVFREAMRMISNIQNQTLAKKFGAFRNQISRPNPQLKPDEDDNYRLTGTSTPAQRAG